MNILAEELYRSFLYFQNEVNNDKESPGYGLVKDDTRIDDMASIACVGFGLSAQVIGVENGYISRQEGVERVLRTLNTFLFNIDHFEGFFVHFLNMQTALPYKKSEYSTIDSVIFLNGAITADSYFQEEEIHSLFMKIFERVNWRSFFYTYNDKLVFRMAYNPHEGGDYRQHSDDSWIYHWHMFAEQLSMYFLAAAANDITAAEAQALFSGFERNLGRYDGYEYYYSPTNALFIYQFSHAWVDFSGLIGIDNIDWFENSRIATLANRKWCIDHQDQYPSLSENTWGLTACLTPIGYRNQCIDPNDLNKNEEHVFGVIPPSGVAGALPFLPEEAKRSLEYIYEFYTETFQKYGFTDGFMLTKDKDLWISPDYIGINKGISLLMIDNYLHQTTWKYYMSHPLIQTAIKKLNFRKK